MYFWLNITSSGRARLFKLVDLTLPPDLPLWQTLSLHACLQDCGVISSGAYQPPLGNCLQVLDLQQGGMRPLCVLPPPTPVQEDVQRNHQQAAEAQLHERIGARPRDPGTQHTRCRVTGTGRRPGKYKADLPFRRRRELKGCSPSTSAWV